MHGKYKINLAKIAIPFAAHQGGSRFACITHVSPCPKPNLLKIKPQILFDKALFWNLCEKSDANSCMVVVCYAIVVVVVASRKVRL